MRRVLLLLSIVSFLVAGSCLAVLAEEPVLRLLVVIEQDFLPAALSVAGLALRSPSAAFRILMGQARLSAFAA